MVEASPLSLQIDYQRRFARLSAMMEDVAGKVIFDETYDAIAERYGVSVSTVIKYARQFGLTRRKRLERLLPQIAQDYARGDPVAPICRRYDCDRKTVWRAARVCGVPLRYDRGGKKLE